MSAIVHCFPDEEAPAQRLADALGLSLGVVQTHRFPDGEMLPRVPEAAHTVIAYRSLDRPDVKLMELLLAADAWRRRGATRLVLAAPYLCYMRQDAVFNAGEPLSQGVVAGLLARSFDRIVTVDAHLHRTRGIEDLPGPARWSNLPAAPAIAAYLTPRMTGKQTLVVGPDSESGAWTSSLADLLGLPFVTLSKTRVTDTSVVLALPADVQCNNRQVVLVDDICSSGGTMGAAVALLAERGADPIDIVVTHALFDDEVRLRLIKAGARTIVSTDSCASDAAMIPLAGVLADALAEETSR